jgi:3-oxoadipate enol-lactonase
MTSIHHFTTGDGCRIAYRLDGPEHLPVLMLSNSIATDHRMWDGQVEDLARSFRVLRYDTRGHGGSDAPAGAYSADRLGRDVVELLDGLGVGPVHFCGLSLGGMIGQWLAIRAPERLRRLVLSNTAAHLEPAAYFDDLVARTLASHDLEATADMFMGNWFPAEMVDTQPQTIAAFRAMVLGTSKIGLAGCFAAVRDLDLRRSLPVITTPTLVIGGEDDTVTLASHSQEIAEAIPGAELLMLPGVHMLNVERPETFVPAVTGFLLESQCQPRSLDVLARGAMLPSHADDMG